MDDITRKRWAFLMEQHKISCEENGDHPDEVDTAYSAGADAIQRLSAIDAKKASVRVDPQIVDVIEDLYDGYDSAISAPGYEGEDWIGDYQAVKTFIDEQKASAAAPGVFEKIEVLKSKIAVQSEQIDPIEMSKNLPDGYSLKKHQDAHDIEEGMCFFHLQHRGKDVMRIFQDQVKTDVTFEQGYEGQAEDLVVMFHDALTVCLEVDHDLEPGGM